MKKNAPISRNLWWHPVSRAISMEKPLGNGWEQFDSVEEFKCFNTIGRVIHQKNIALVRQKNVILQSSPLIEYKIDFCLEIGETQLFIEYKGDWVKFEASASTLLNYQLALIIPKCPNFWLISKTGNLLPKNHWAKYCEYSMSWLEFKLQQTIMELRNGRQ